MPVKIKLGLSLLVVLVAAIAFYYPAFARPWTASSMSSPFSDFS